MEYELYHHGTKNMKWGQRLYQNKDGSLTPLGRLRYLKGDKDRKDDGDTKTPETKPKNHESYDSARKSVSNMSDAELNSAINRLRNEQTYQQLYNQMHPQQVNKAKEFISNAWDKAIQPAVLEAGKDALKKFLTKAAADAMGLNGDEALSAMEKLEKQAKVTRLESEIALNKRKKQETEEWFQKREDKKKNKNDSNKESDKESLSDEQRKKQQEEAKKAMAENEKEWKAKVDELNQRTYDGTNKAKEYEREAERAAADRARDDKFRKETEKIISDIDARTQKAADKQAKADEKAQAKSDKYKDAYEKAKESSKVYEGTVEGEGQSRFTGWKSEKNSKTYDVDFDWSNSEVKPTTSLSVVSTSVARTSGQQFLNSFLLEDKSN